MGVPRGRQSIRLDAALALALAVLGECEIVVKALNSDFPGPRWINQVWVVLMAVPVAFRRRYPAAALVAFWLPVQIWLDVVYDAHSNLPLEPFVALLVVSYSAAAYVQHERIWVLYAVLGLLYTSEVALLIGGLKGLGNVVPGLVFITLTFGIGWAMRSRRVEARSLRRDVAIAHGARDAAVREAVDAERDRIARELHDVVAHSVSVMVVQAGAGERMTGTDHDGVEAAFKAIRHAGSDAIDEMHRLLSLLRGHEQTDSAAPQPRLDRLDALVAESHAAGEDVALQVAGTPVNLPAGLDLAAYRIVQEALTNARKHAPGTKVVARLEWRPHELLVEVENSAPVVPAGDTASDTGRGQIGITERVALYGGRADFGPVEGGGYRVTASLPIGRDPS